jgi:tRNA G10  N-methylase Trm11
MKSPNRDLLVLLKDETMSEQAIEQEVEKLNTILFNVETSESFYTAHELFDMNRFKIFRGKKHLLQVSREKTLKPFTFLCNLN